MAPHTRQAQRAARNQAKGGLDGSHVSSEHATSLNILNRVNVIGQDIIDKDSDNLQTNLTGGFKTLASGITNITKSQKETHLTLP